HRARLRAVLPCRPVPIRARLGPGAGDRARPRAGARWAGPCRERRPARCARKRRPAGRPARATSGNRCLRAVAKACASIRCNGQEPGAPERSTEASVAGSDDRDALRAEEARLLARIVEHDQAAFEALYQRYAGALYSLAYQVTRAERFAQDVVQEVFVAVWRDSSRFD